MDLQEQHWHNIWKSYDPKGKAWHGIWTVYSPEKKVLKSFQGIRKIWTNEDQTTIYHRNNYTYEDGSTTEKQWEMNKENSNLSDGLYHPAALSMRGLSSEHGIDAWVSKKYEVGQPFAAELFFRSSFSRTSIAHIYKESGELEKITYIQELLDEFPSQSFIEPIEARTGNWQGKQKIMTPDLKIYPETEIKDILFNPDSALNLKTFLPDKIIANAPKKIELGEKFEINVEKFISEKQVKRLRILYDENGQFYQLICEVLEQLN